MATRNGERKLQLPVVQVASGLAPRAVSSAVGISSCGERGDRFSERANRPVAEALNWLMVHSVDLFAHFGIASVRLPEYTVRPAAVYVLYYAPVATIAFA